MFSVGNVIIGGRTDISKWAAFIAGILVLAIGVWFIFFTDPSPQKYCMSTIKGLDSSDGHSLFTSLGYQHKRHSLVIDRDGEVIHWWEYPNAILRYIHLKNVQLDVESHGCDFTEETMKEFEREWKHGNN